MIGYIGNDHSLDFYAGATFYVKDELIGFKTIGRLFHALNTGEVVGILIPYITGKDGLLHDGISRLASHHFHIEREIVLDVKLELVAKQPNIDDVTEVIITYDDYQASYRTINQLKQLQKKTFVDTRQEALNTLDNDSQAVIVTNYDHHEWHTLKSDIRDHNHNKHVYLLVGQTLKTNGFHNRVMLQVTFNKTDRFSVYNSLHEAVMADIDVSNIAHVETGVTTDHRFLMTLHGHLEDERVIQLLTVLKHKAKQVQLLGSFYSK